MRDSRERRCSFVSSVVHGSRARRTALYPGVPPAFASASKAVIRPFRSLRLMVGPPALLAPPLPPPPPGPEGTSSMNLCGVDDLPLSDASLAPVGVSSGSHNLVASLATEYQST